MSLINQMLRDLEQRSHSTSVDKPTLAIKAPEPQPKGGRRQTLLIIVATLSAAFFAWQRFPWDTRPALPSTASANPATPTATANALPADPPQPFASPTPSQTTSAAVADTEATESHPTAPTLSLEASAPEESKAAEVTQTSIAEPKTANPSNPQRQRNTPKAAAANHRFSRRPSADALYQQALGSSSYVTRKEQLYDVLAQDPSHLPARTLLLQTLLKIGSTDEIETFLRQSLHQHPRHPAFVTAMAHLQTQRHDYRAAVATLEMLDPDSNSDPTYLALLAASHQQLRDYAIAADLYQRLTDAQPEKAEHWLGLGLCAEQLQQKQTALRAYREALAKNSLGGSVVDYINQRLNALN